MWRFSCSLSGHTGHIGAPVKLTIEPIMVFTFGARSTISFNYMSLQYLFLEPHLTIYQLREVTKLGTSTLWPRAVTMKLWGPLKLIQRLPWNIEIKSFVWSRAFKCTVKTYKTRFLTECYFITILFMGALLHNKWYQIKVFDEIWSVMVSQFCVRPTSRRRACMNPADHETLPIVMLNSM